jgi:hypothetical protein
MGFVFLNYFRLNKATKREGREKIQTKTVTATENAAIKGYDKIKNTSKMICPAVIGLFLLFMLL